VNDKHYKPAATIVSVAEVLSDICISQAILKISHCIAPK